MRSASDRIRWLVEGFGRAELEAASPADRLKLREQIAEFLAIGGEPHEPADLAGVVPIVSRKKLEKVPDAWLSSLQQDARGLIEPAADAYSGSWRGRSVPIAIGLNILFSGINPEAPRSMVAKGEPRDVFLYVAAALLAQEGNKVIRRCPACSRLFVKRRRQRYCDRACTNRVNFRDWQKTGKGKARAKARAKKRKTKAGRAKEARAARVRYAASRLPARVTPRKQKGGER